MASVARTFPNRSYPILEASQPGSARARHVLNKDELPPGLQDSQYLLDGASLICHATEHKSADDGIDRAIWNRQAICGSIAQLDLQSKSMRLFFEILEHKKIGLNANPLNAIFRKVLKIGTSTWSNLQDIAGKVSKELSFAARHKLLVFGIQMSKRPRKRPLAPRTHSSRDYRSRPFLIVQGSSRLPGVIPSRQDLTALHREFPGRLFVSVSFRLTSDCLTV